MVPRFFIFFVLFWQLGAVAGVDAAPVEAMSASTETPSPADSCASHSHAGQSDAMRSTMPGLAMHPQMPAGKDSCCRQDAGKCGCPVVNVLPNAVTILQFRPDPFFVVDIAIPHVAHRIDLLLRPPI